MCCHKPIVWMNLIWSWDCRHDFYDTASQATPPQLIWHKHLIYSRMRSYCCFISTHRYQPDSNRLNGSWQLNRLDPYECPHFVIYFWFRCLGFWFNELATHVSFFFVGLGNRQFLSGIFAKLGIPHSYRSSPSNIGLSSPKRKYYTSKLHIHSKTHTSTLIHRIWRRYR